MYAIRTCIRYTYDTYVYKGGALGALSHEAKFKQDVKYKVITLKKIKKDIFKTLQGSPLGGPLSRTEISTGRKNTKQTQRRGRNNIYVLTSEVKFH